ncbi:MAG TPA: toll/interleukin-1 receptor domain-containing protein [Methyloceanibacter sp.]|nr:toll/interleukin-1 receptor domain-containing protein [Methyloceanibacter sp.]
MADANNSPKIVVSYRRADSAMSGRIFDRLVERFGQNSLFIDIDNIPFGGDFRKHIADALTSSDLLVAVIGRDWLGRRENAAARIMNAADPVRVEIETAMRSSVPILPVLIDGAVMPDPEQLPDSIKEFAFLNALEIESGRDFKVHIQRLFGAVAQFLGGKVAAEEAVASGTPVGLLSPTPAPVKDRKRSLLPILLGSLLLAALLGGTLWFLLRERSSSQSAGPTAAPEFCNALYRVIAEARTQFTGILGPQSSGLWTARIQAPGWQDCTVRDWTYEGKTIRYYSCSLPTYQTLDEINARLNVERVNVKACLGGEWIEHQLPLDQGQETVTYEAGQNDPIVGLRTSYYDSSKDWTLRLTVDAPQAR